MKADDELTRRDDTAQEPAAGAPAHASVLLYWSSGVEVVPLVEGEPKVVGRSDPADVIVPLSTISRQHARFERVEDQFFVADLGSTNGTTKNGERIQDRVEIRPGDEVSFGGLRAYVHLLDSKPETRAGLLDHDSFSSALDLETERAAYFRRSFALLVVNTPAPEALRPALRPVDRVGRYGPRSLEVLLPEATREEALEIAKRAAAASNAPAGVAVFPESGASAEALLEAALAAVRRARAGRIEVAEDGAPDSRLERARDGEPAVIKSEAMRAIYETVDRLARSGIPVLLLGETGTGKEVIARALHERGPRRDHPLRSINCAAIAPQLMESALFGHERGAFTGAAQRAEGVFEAAGAGTILLDEIGELSLAAQAALLRVLETKRVTRLGSNREIEVHARVIAATHRDLEAMCEAGTFRLDLLYRLNAMSLRVPPLRERPEEIVPLAEHFLRAASAANERAVEGFEPEALGYLCRYRWPGNVRELKNVIDRAVVVTREDRIGVDDLPERVLAQVESGPHQHTPARAPAPLARAPSLGGDTVRIPTGIAGNDREPSELRDKIQAYERDVLLDALARARFKKADAARRAGIPIRTLVNKLKALDLERTTPGDGEIAAARERVRAIDAEVFADDPPEEFRIRVARFEARLITEALEREGGNKSAVSRRLGIPIRTLANKLDTYQTPEPRGSAQPSGEGPPRSRRPETVDSPREDGADLPDRER